MTEELEQLLLVQAHDILLEQLRHRRETLPERAQLEACLAEAKQLIPQQKSLKASFDDTAREERRLETEAGDLRAKAAEVDKLLYSGTISSPRELQALQADIEQLKHHAARVEDTQLDRMGERETLGAELAPIDERLVALRADVARLRESIADAEAAIDAEMAAERDQRTSIASAVGTHLLGDYDRRRGGKSGQGVARLLGDTCQACRLSIPATEVDQIRHDESGRMWYCDNCGAILVAS